MYMIKYLSILLLVIAAKWSPTYGYGAYTFTYMAVVPNSIRPNTDLRIPIKFNTKVQKETVTVQLFDRNSNTKVIAENSVSFPGAVEEGTVTLKVPSTISWGNYRINITGTGPIPFKNSTTAYGRTKAISIFVQTDKAIYKPKDTVYYRVFTADGALQPLQATLDIEIYDPKGNKIAEQMKVKPTGTQTIDGELELTELTPLGTWEIRVNAPEYGEYAKETYRFDVQEYVLPKFEVTVTLPPYALATDMSLKGTVKAQYVFGKNVEGHVVLDVKRRYGAGFYQVAAARTDFSINGEANFVIPKDILEQVADNLDYATILIEAKVTETITGITQSGSGEVRFHKQPYKIEFHPTMPDNFKPGFTTYTILLKVTDQDGKPPGPLTKKVNIDITYFMDKIFTNSIPYNVTFPNFDFVGPFMPGDVVILNTISKTPATDGTVKFDIDIPTTVATATIKAEFNGETVSKQLSRFRSREKHFLQVKILNTGPLTIGDFASIEVKNDVKQAAKAQYIVKSKGLIVETGTISIKNNGVGSKQLKLTREMAPSARIVVYYQSNDDVVADGVNFIIENIFENEVSLNFNRTGEVKPKGGVKLTVNADANSFVGVLVVDKSVKLLKEGNDITQDRVSNEMRQYGDSPWFPRSNVWGRVVPWSFTADDVSDIFNNAQLQVLTDGYLHDFNLWSLRQPDTQLRRVGFAGGAAMMESAPMQMKSADAAGGEGPTGQIRKDFPETWIWKTATAKNGVAEFPDIVPDTMTTFVATAFALNDKTGIGVAGTPAELNVVLPFFVNLQLPYSIVRGETAVIQANIFNYYPEDLLVNVTLYGSSDFNSITIVNGKEEETAESNMKCVLVRSNSATPVYFNVKPKIIGDVKFIIRATNLAPRNVFDQVEREIPVKAEGEEKEANIPVLITMKTNGFITETYNWPAEAATPDVVLDSEKVKITVIGDVFGPSLKNLGKLIRLPYGCGEQNMLNFAPSVFAAVYMNITGRFMDNTALQLKITEALRTGYQRQMLYQRSDGSFSAFGNADKKGSLWLTSFVLKSFAQASRLQLIFIDPRVISRSVNFILDNQNRTGFFMNTGKVIHKAMQGGTTSSQRVLTAYIAIVLHEVKNTDILDPITSIRVTDGLNSAIKYLSSEVGMMTTDYEKAIGAYALKLAGHAACDTLLNSLEQSPNKVTEGKSVHWDNPSYSMEIEIASYVLMTYTRNKATNKGMEILYWLVRQRGPFGGYASTQDTVVAVQATSEFAALIYAKNVSLSIDVIATKNSVLQPKIHFDVNEQNMDILQFKETDKFDSVTIEATGSGLAMVDIGIFYNVLKEPGQQSYILTLKTLEETLQRYVLKACAKYNIPNSESNMAILDVGAISGFEPIQDQIEMTPLIKRIEYPTGRAVFYFDEIPSTEVCVDVPMQRYALVSTVKPATVVAYSYYEPSERRMMSYIPKMFQQATLCNICGSECGCTGSSASLPMAQCSASGAPYG